jgi:tetratricopeptide (TPR) repeat protein
MALAALIVAPFATVQASSAQQEMGRVKVLVPDLFATDGQDRGWGEDVAKELRGVINELATHQPIERNDIRDQLRRFELKMEDLNCISTIQLAPQISAGVAFCADFRVSGDNRELFDIAFIDATSSARFPVEDFVVHKDQKKEAAARIGAAFDVLVQQLRFRLFCFDYAQQEDWTAALRNCDDALGLNGDDQGVRYQRAQALRQLDRMDEALTEVQTILEVDPYDEDALNLGGYLATTLGQAQEGREYYGRYLEVNPNAEAVRRRIAYEMFQAGDAEGALLLIEEGLENDDSPDLLGDLGSYAMEAARQATPEGAQPGTDNELPPEVIALYRKAIGALEQVFEARGDSMDVGQVRNIVSAYAQIGEAENAVTFAEQALAVYPEEAALLSTYSTALQRLERIDDAVSALQRIEAIDPEYPDLFARQSDLLIRAGRRDDAIPIMQRAIQQGADANRLAQLLFSDAYQKGLDTRNANRNLDYGIAGVQAAKQLDINAETKAQMDFWHGYGLYLKGVASQEANTLESARRSQPMFEQSLPLLRAGASYAPSVGINSDQIIQAAQQYLDIQNAIIRRGR